DQYNENNRLIEEALENTVSRDGTTPNTLLADIDANSNSINNVLTTRTQVLYINGQQATVGAIGEKGEQGDAGADGVDGIDGVDGVDGTDGTDGVDGITGVVVQVVNMSDGEVATGANLFSFDNVIPTDSEGELFMQKPFYPTHAANLLRIDVVANLSNDSVGGSNISIGLCQYDVPAALACVTTPRLEHQIANMTITHWMTAGTTNQITFIVRGGADAAGTTTFNGVNGSRIHGGVMASSITITEYTV
ncbi:MAG: collagen-like protein, partial [Gammaproteobacteria bacterium]|nr:collagen-like protein [Gammaproteobacteria bacterium]